MKRNRSALAVIGVAVLAAAGFVAAGGGDAYAGKAGCGACHGRITASFAKTPHAHSLDTLKAGDSDNNPECLACHVTGFDGDAYAEGAVSCEACHGPGAAHIAARGRARTAALAPTNEDTCRRCHTAEWSPDWDYAAYKRTGIHGG